MCRTGLPLHRKKLDRRVSAFVTISGNSEAQGFLPDLSARSDWTAVKESDFVERRINLIREMIRKIARQNPKAEYRSSAASLTARLLLFTLFLGVSSWLTIQAVAQPADTIETFPAGGGPNALAFDGSNIWVTNIYD